VTGTAVRSTATGQPRAAPPELGIHSKAPVENVFFKMASWNFVHTATTRIFWQDLCRKAQWAR